MQEKLFAKNLLDYSQTIAKDLFESVTYPWEALENLVSFDMRGILLYVDNKPVAMALGSEISPLCFDINFEKALTEYDGSYSVINQEFAKRLTAYPYINREEDMGIEGLKKAKLSYHPAIIYDRYDGVPQW